MWYNNSGILYGKDGAGMDEKQFYELPTLEIVTFASDDILTTSGEDDIVLPPVWF